MGNEYLYQTMAGENIELLKGYGVRQDRHHLSALLQHAGQGLSRSRPRLRSHLPHRLSRRPDGRRQTFPAEGATFDCTYHDSCYLGRHNGIYEPPRRLIEAAGGRIVEMARNRDQAFCCSAGGGRILAEEKLGSRINIKRVEQASATGAGLLLANCPFCLTMFEDGVKGANVEETLRPRDIAELLAERLPA
jgi:Fe-S oxidoreductase